MIKSKLFFIPIIVFNVFFDEFRLPAADRLVIEFQVEIGISIYLSKYSVLKYNEYSGTIGYQGTSFRIIQVFFPWLLSSFVTALESDGILDNHIRVRAQMPIYLQGSSAHDLLNRRSGQC